jgi:hypothetical protein
MQKKNNTMVKGARVDDAPGSETNLFSTSAVLFTRDGGAGRGCRLRATGLIRIQKESI